MLKIISVVGFLLGAGCQMAIAGPLASAVTSARIVQLEAHLSPEARAWMHKEAKREAAENNISEAVATQAVKSSGVDLNVVSVEDAVVLIMQYISDDARKDMKESLAEQQAILDKKKALRDGLEQKKENRLNANLRQGLGEKVDIKPQSTQASNQQKAMASPEERLRKAEEVSARMLKKISDTQSSMAANIK